MTEVMIRAGALAVKPTRSVPLQVSRALAVSAVAAILDFGSLVLLVEKLALNPEISAIGSYLFGGVANYALCACWVFPKAPQNATIGFGLFTLLSLGGLGITWVCMQVLHGWMGLHYALAKVVALGLAFGWNFTSRKWLLFH